MSFLDRTPRRGAFALLAEDESNGGSDPLEELANIQAALRRETLNSTRELVKPLPASVKKRAFNQAKVPCNDDAIFQRAGITPVQVAETYSVKANQVRVV